MRLSNAPVTSLKHGYLGLWTLLLLYTAAGAIVIYFTGYAPRLRFSIPALFTGVFGGLLSAGVEFAAGVFLKNRLGSTPAPRPGPTDFQASRLIVEACGEEFFLRGVVLGGLANVLGTLSALVASIIVSAGVSVEGQLTRYSALQPVLDALLFGLLFLYYPSLTVVATARVASSLALVALRKAAGAKPEWMRFGNKAFPAH